MVLPGGPSETDHSSPEGQRIQGEGKGGLPQPPTPPDHMFRPQGPEGTWLGSPVLTASPLSPACSPGINRSTSPNPASLLLPEAGWRGATQSLKGPQQGSLGRKQGDREESSVSSSSSHQTLQRQPAALPPAQRTCRNLLPPTCLLQGYRGPRSSPCTAYSASGRLAPAQAHVGCPGRGRLLTETHPHMHGPAAWPQTCTCGFTV